jgi:hypothetical protein
VFAFGFVHRTVCVGVRVSTRKPVAASVMHERVFVLADRLMSALSFVHRTERVGVRVVLVSVRHGVFFEHLDFRFSSQDCWSASTLHPIA